MNNFVCRLITAVVALGFLNYGLCSPTVTCYQKNAVGEESYCYITEFPANPNREPYHFLVNWLPPIGGIEYVEFSPSEQVHPTIEYVPKEIFATFPKLKSLALANTDITELCPDDFSGAIELESLYLTKNKIKNISSSVLSPLASWEIAALRKGGRIIDFYPINYPLNRLQKLALDVNEITDIEDYAFYGLYALTHLDLNANQLTVIRQLTFAGLPSLKSLDLSNNKIETIEDGALKLPALTFLALRLNKLKRLSDRVFQDLRASIFINLDENQIESVGKSLQGAQNVESISLEGNHIRDLDLIALSKLPNLRWLSIEDTGFTFPTTLPEDDVKSNSKLTHLGMGRNNLSDATELAKLKIFRRISVLSLRENLFASLNIGENITLTDVLPELKTVDLRGMKLDCNDLTKPNLIHTNVSEELVDLCEIK